MQIKAAEPRSTQPVQPAFPGPTDTNLRCLSRTTELELELVYTQSSLFKNPLR
ncbi:UNVERIFIED_CONTAM: hypothetical protein FKN15_038266 [Acipenser sinensis]